MSTIPNQASDSPAISTPGATADLVQLEFRRSMGQISRQSLMFFLGTVFTMGAGYLVKIYIARVLGAEQLGLYTLGMTLVSLTQLVAVLGLPSAAGRYVAAYNATGRFEELRGFLTRSVAVVVFLNLIFSSGLLLCGPWIARHLYHAPALGQYIPFLAALTILGSLNVFYCQVLAGFKDVAKRTVITNFIGSPLVIVLTVVLLASGTGMRGYLAAQIANSVVVVALLVAATRKLTPPAARFSRDPLPSFDPDIRAFAAAAFGMGVLDFLVTQADKIVLGLCLSPALVGIYAVASTLSALIPIILQSVNQIFAPVIAELRAQARHEVLEKLFQTLTKWVLGLTLPLAFVVMAFALPLMRIFGPGFDAGWPVVVIGAIGQVVNCGVGSVGFLLLMSGNQRRLMRVQFAMAGVSVLVNVALIPVLGIVGAAVAAACVNAGSNLWNLFEVRTALRISPYNRSYLALLVPAVLTASIVVLLRVSTASITHPWLIILLALGLAYVVFAISAMAFALDQDNRMITRAAWSLLRKFMPGKEVSAA